MSEPERLSYERLLCVLSRLPDDQAAYVLKFLQANEQKCQRAAEKLEQDRDDLAREVAHYRAIADRSETKVRVAQQQLAKVRKKLSANPTVDAQARRAVSVINNIEGYVRGHRAATFVSLMASLCDRAHAMNLHPDRVTIHALERCLNEWTELCRLAKTGIETVQPLREAMHVEAKEGQ